MKCIIDETVDTAVRKNKKVDVIARYLRMKYRLNIDTIALKQRVAVFQRQNELRLASLAN